MTPHNYLDSRSYILAFDLGTTMGWAAFDGEKITSGSSSFKPKKNSTTGYRFCLFKQWLADMKGKLGHIERVYFEEVRAHKGTQAAHIYGGFKALLLTWCERHEIPYIGVPVGTIKKSATGHGNANKEMMIRAAEALGHAPEDDNEADALALIYCAKRGVV